MSSKALFSVVILCYRNFEFLYEAIDTVLRQSYEEIELIVSDDGSPDFPQDEIKAYIESNKKKNLTKYLVNHVVSNQGTVKHINEVLLLCCGTYISFFASDDMLQDDNVLKQYVNCFKECGDNCNLVMAQTAMYDRAMQKWESYFLKPDVLQIISEPIQYDLLFQRLARGACLTSGSTCYRKDFFEKYGYFDEHFTLIEDYPLHLRLAIEKIPFYYKNFVALRHRDGGISHGAIEALSTSKIKYYTDERNCYNLVLQQTYKIPISKRKTIENRIKNHCTWLDDLLYMKGRGLSGAIIFFQKHPFVFLKKGIDKGKIDFKNWGIKRLASVLLLLYTVPICANSFANVFPYFSQQEIQLLMVNILLFMSLFTAVLVICQYAFRLIHAILTFPFDKTNILY